MLRQREIISLSHESVRRARTALVQAFVATDRAPAAVITVAPN